MNGASSSIGRYLRQMPPAALPDFNARQLEAVLALVEYGSFVAAAARLRISQPALTAPSNDWKRSLVCACSTARRGACR